MNGTGTSDLCVVGLGYIGLPTAVVFATAGLAVTGVDIDPMRVETINAGQAPMSEPGLSEALGRAVASGRLAAITAPARADAFIIAVPTPLGPGKRPDLSHVWAATEALAPVLMPGNLVILESTVPPGTTDEMAARLAGARPDLVIAPATGATPPVRLAHCPERVLPGKILAELRTNDRIVGGLSPSCASAAARLYARILDGRCHLTDARTAEATKLAENAFRDVNIAFANELDLICRQLGVDARTMIRLANRHPRVDILSPGPGVGGHCIAVDPWFLAAAAPRSARLIRAARAINDARPGEVATRAAGMVSDLDAPVIACFGLAYKADIGDLRESPAVEACQMLAGLNLGPVLAVEPYLEAPASPSAPRLPAGLGNVELVGMREALARADLAVLLVDHRCFRALPPRALGGIRILDTRGIWSGTATAGLPIEAGGVPAQRPEIRNIPAEELALATV